MSVGRVRPSSPRWVRLFALMAATYALVLSAGELQHHDLACHLKSRTHCTACVSGVSGPGLVAAGEPSGRAFRPLGRVHENRQPAALAPAIDHSQGRSPPAA